MLKSKKDTQLGAGDGHQVRQPIDGATVHPGLSIPYERGVLTEMLRPEWDTSGQPVLHVHQVRMFGGVVSAWHMHRETTDRLFVNLGYMKVVLYDDRKGSRTRGQVNELFAGDARPSLIVIPAGVWHGIQNLGTTDGLYLNFASHPYNYESPDHYRLPHSTREIPYRWDSDLTTLRARSPSS
jgi:dTDP-4-dehydrorhamnose 3,5-epimerase